MELDFNCKKSLQENGFEGFCSMEDLWKNKDCIPKHIGVYLVLNPKFNDDDIEFLKKGSGGWFKQKDPNVDIKELEKKFVSNSLVVYIGKAGVNEESSKATLSSRLNQYLRFGQGKPVGHSGGRYIWQLKNYKDLLLCWKITENENPKDIEAELCDEYKKKFNTKLPFANLVASHKSNKNHSISNANII